MDNNFIEELLHEEEGSDFDTKREQYKFTPPATEWQKSELLKDILAFANAWRRSDAYILIGAEDVKGGRNKVVGITEQLDDADIQQFVNKKTQKPIDFSFKNLIYKEKNIAIIHIPVQERPFFLLKKFGKLEANTVYIRRGSSTDIADPDEILRMGSASVIQNNAPKIEVFFADTKTQKRLPDTLTLFSEILDAPPKHSIPDYREKYPAWGGLMPGVNSNYYRELVEYTQFNKFVSPISIAITNTGTSTANDVNLEIRISKNPGDVFVVESNDYSDAPKEQYDLMSRVNSQVMSTFGPCVKDIGDQWIIELAGGKLQSNATCWLEEPIYVAVKKDCSVTLDVTIFCDEYQSPVLQQLKVDATCARKKVDLEDIKQMEAERFVASPEWQEQLARMKKNEAD